ncbi:WhiB family transcriptional regulator [Streptomyces sp. BE147]|uniref:WhiB family transcriptional regulator n=1 Tax=Streptomyces sp. BE147 TaxID=3002524 RepID=UPI002E7774AE|nr:WhiB family transcriptional regulator [Streptomyces sp. BE147]MEE1735945.1 WhiB family transcriptional regulator [Streptomyces sp. BE147]
MINLPAFLTQGHAACTTEPNLFHTATPADELRAIAICQDCPLRTACANHALTTPEPRGTWGGLTASERRRILSPRSNTYLDAEGRVRVPCGSYKALQSHLRYGETCDECRAAQDARTLAQRRTRLAQEHAGGGSVTGAAIHRRIGEPVCADCAGAERQAWLARPAGDRTWAGRKRRRELRAAERALPMAS